MIQNYRKKHRVSSGTVLDNGIELDGRLDVDVSYGSIFNASPIIADKQKNQDKTCAL